MSFEVLRQGGGRVVVRDAAFDGRSRTDLLVEKIAENLVDQAGRSYSASFNGHSVSFFDEAGSHEGRWVLGSAPVRIRGGTPLDPRFLFTFFDHGPTAQRLNALWEFAGSAGEAIEAFAAAGFRQSRHDAQLKSGVAGRIHLRTPGGFWTGNDSAHAILHENADGRTTGEIHVGEHNPLRGFGIGFLLHQWEIRRGGLKE